MNENKIGEIIVDTSIELHKELDPGLLEALMKDGISGIINRDIK